MEEAPQLESAVRILKACFISASQSATAEKIHANSLRSTNSDSKQVHSYSQEAQILIDDLHARELVLTSLEQAHRLLKQELGEIRLMQQKCLAAPCPISSLPFELLSTIFEFACLTPISNTMITAVFDRYRHHLCSTRSALQQTCSSWKRVVLSTSALWTDVFIGRASSHKASKYLKDVLIPSRLRILNKRPLDLHVRAWDPDTLLSSVTSLIETLLPQCRTLEMTVEHDLSIGGNDTLFNIPSPLLESLAMRFIPWTNLGNDVIMLYLLPRLTSLYIDHDGTLENELRIYIPIETNLQHLHLVHTVAFESAMKIIHYSPRLQTLTWSRTVAPEEGDELRPWMLGIPLPHLHTMRMKGLQPITQLASINAPNLRRLCVGGSFTMNDARWMTCRERVRSAAFASMFPQLESFNEVIYEYPNPDLHDDIDHVFQSFVVAHPNLKELVLHRELNQDVVDILTETNDQGLLFSNLQRVWGYVPFRIDQQEVASPESVEAGSDSEDDELDPRWKFDKETLVRLLQSREIRSSPSAFSVNLSDAKFELSHRWRNYGEEDLSELYEMKCSNLSVGDADYYDPGWGRTTKWWAEMDGSE